MRQMNNLVGLFYSVHLRRHLISPDGTKPLINDRKGLLGPSRQALRSFSKSAATILQVCDPARLGGRHSWFNRLRYSRKD
jgi:hypothetical protein